MWTIIYYYYSNMPYYLAVLLPRKWISFHKWSFFLLCIFCFFFSHFLIMFSFIFTVHTNFFYIACIADFYFTVFCLLILLILIYLNLSVSIVCSFSPIHMSKKTLSVTSASGLFILFTFEYMTNWLLSN